MLIIVTDILPLKSVSPEPKKRAKCTHLSFTKFTAEFEGQGYDMTVEYHPTTKVYSLVEQKTVSAWKEFHETHKEANLQQLCYIHHDAKTKREQVMDFKYCFVLAEHIVYLPFGE